MTQLERLVRDYLLTEALALACVPLYNTASVGSQSATDWHQAVREKGIGVVFTEEVEKRMDYLMANSDRVNSFVERRIRIDAGDECDIAFVEEVTEEMNDLAHDLYPVAIRDGHYDTVSEAESRFIAFLTKVSDVL